MARSINSDRPEQHEVWLRGALPGIPVLLNPVAHALLQAREDVETLMVDFPEDLLWTRPGNIASAGFHLQHLSGVLDRLFTYARGERLSAAQLEVLENEEKKPTPAESGQDMVAAFHRQVDRSLDVLRHCDEGTLTQSRLVGRGQLPSTVLGLFVHAAEHTQRHVGQLLVTVKVQRKSC